jgi:hypothetical protein
MQVERWPMAGDRTRRRSASASPEFTSPFSFSNLELQKVARKEIGAPCKVSRHAGPAVTLGTLISAPIPVLNRTPSGKDIFPIDR